MGENRHIGIAHHQFEQLVIRLLEKLKSVAGHTTLVTLKVQK